MILTKKRLASIICTTVVTLPLTQASVAEESIGVDEVLSSLTANQATIEKDNIGSPRFDPNIENISDISYPTSSGNSLSGDNTFKVAILDQGFEEGYDHYKDNRKIERIRGHGTLVKDIVEQYTGKDGKLYSSESYRRLLVDELTLDHRNNDRQSIFYGNLFAYAVEVANRKGAYDYVNFSGGSNIIQDTQIISLYNELNSNNVIVNGWGNLTDDEKNNLAKFFVSISNDHNRLDNSNSIKENARKLAVNELTIVASQLSLSEDERNKLLSKHTDSLADRKREQLIGSYISYGYKIISIKDLIKMGTHVYLANGNNSGKISIGSLLIPLNNTVLGSVNIIGALDKIQSSSEQIKNVREVENNNVVVGFLGQEAQQGGSTRFAPAIAPYQLVPELVDRYKSFKNNNYRTSSNKKYAPAGVSFATPYVLVHDLLKKAGWTPFANDQEHIKSIVGPDDEESDGYLYIDPRK